MARYALILSCCLAVSYADPASAAVTKTAFFHARDGAVAFMRGQYEKAVAAYGAALESRDLSDFRRARILNNRGVAKWRLRQGEAAIRDFNAAIELYPEYAEAYNNRGIVLLDLGQPKLALADFDGAVRLAPGYGAAFNNRGNAYFALGDYRAAFEAYGKAAKVLPGQAAPRGGLGRTHAALKRPFAATRDLSRAIALNPNYASAYRSRGDAHLALQRYGKAIKDYGDAIARGAAGASVYLSRARAHVGSRQYDKAVQDVTKAIELDPRSAESHALLGEIRVRLKLYDQALSDLTRALSIDPEHVRALTLRARSFLALGQAETALKDVEAALSVNPESAAVQAIRGEIHEAQQRTDAAIADYRRALRLDPGNDRGRTGLLRLTGEMPEAAVADLDLHPPVEGWVVRRSASGRYVARNPEHPKVEAPLEMYGSGEPRILEWRRMKKPFAGIGLLRYDAGSLEDGAGGRAEYVAIVDLWKNAVVAVEPHLRGEDEASWRWTQASVVVTDPDGTANTIELRKLQPVVLGARRYARVRSSPRRSRARRWNRGRGGASFFRGFGN